jgi:hypothetical protein
VIIGVLWVPLHQNVHWNPGYAKWWLTLGDLDPRPRPCGGVDRGRWYVFAHKTDTMDLRLTLSVPRFASSEPKR